MGYIYCITNLINNKKYIGKTVLDISERFNEHCRDSKKQRCNKRPLYNAMNKYGIESFIIEKLIECPNDKLDEYEKYYIKKFNTYGHNGYNATKGGDGTILYDYNRIIETYKLGYNIQECADIYSCSRDTVKKILKSNNIPIRHIRCGCCTEPKCVMLYSIDNKFILKFNSITLAAHWLVDNNYAKTYNTGVKTHISLCMRGKSKSAYNFIWK